RDELQHKTWSTLLMLPRSTREVAFGKLLGCALPLAPEAVLVAVGLVLSGGLWGLTQAMYGPWIWSAIMPVLIFVCLTTWLSLHLKWGALPTALVITLFTHNCVISPLLVISMLLIGLGSGRGIESMGDPSDMVAGAITSLGFAGLSVGIVYGFMVFIVRDLEAAGER
ncbi:MAG TPA: hypothetical protein VHB77_03045, partial [Planctomycetaceae bacterium]|nr:hypothetical protein [Planctomycetaceae bacterium]